MLGGNVDDVVDRAVNGHICNVEWLGEHVPIHRLSKELSEMSDVDIRWREGRLIAVDSSPLVVVSTCGYVYLRADGKRNHQEKHYGYCAAQDSPARKLRQTADGVNWF